MQTWGHAAWRPDSLVHWAPPGVQLQRRDRVEVPFFSPALLAGPLRDAYILPQTNIYGNWFCNHTSALLLGGIYVSKMFRDQSWMTPETKSMCLSMSTPSPVHPPHPRHPIFGISLPRYLPSSLVRSLLHSMLVACSYSLWGVGCCLRSGALPRPPLFSRHWVVHPPPFLGYLLPSCCRFYGKMFCEPGHSPHHFTRASLLLDPI